VSISDGRYHCIPCNRFLKSRDSATQHLRCVHVRQAVKCIMCDVVKSSLLSFRVHINQRHGIKGVKDVVGTYGRLMGECVASAYLEPERHEAARAAMQLQMGGDADYLSMDAYVPAADM
jgi:hypothetical protein